MCDLGQPASVFGSAPYAKGGIGAIVQRSPVASRIFNLIGGFNLIRASPGSGFHVSRLVKLPRRSSRQDVSLAFSASIETCECDSVTIPTLPVMFKPRAQRGADRSCSRLEGAHEMRRSLHPVSNSFTTSSTRRLPASSRSAASDSTPSRSSRNLIPCSRKKLTDSTCHLRASMKSRNPIAWC